MQQSGFAIGRTSPRAKVFLDGQMLTRASDEGFFYLGFDRDAGPSAQLRIDARGADVVRQLQIDRAEYDIQRIKGLRRVYQGQASPELEARIADETKRKAAAFASVTDRDDFKSGFSAPLRDFRVTARFGGQRIIDGRPRPPHYGIDLAAPTGTPVSTPAGGLVVLADPGMLFEGGLVMIDHGVPLPELQYEIQGLYGQTWRVDFAWPDARVAAEYEGLDWHSGPLKMIEDKTRFAGIQERAWTVIPIVAQDVRRYPSRLADRIAYHLTAARLVG